MHEYQNLVYETLKNGTYKPNRTGVDTVADFSQHYRINLDSGYPLLTTKKMDGYRWNSMIHELFWYLDGEEHIRNLREETKIWDAWADDDGHLDTAYGRFWRRYPIPDEDNHLPGESWDRDTNQPWITKETDDRLTFDQIERVIHNLKENPHSRRHVITAWHPANATCSTLPPCHYTFVFNVQDGRLNLHLTQRSGDIALGIPFNIACYSLLLKMIANETNHEPGEFAHTIVDAHIYCGKGQRGEWYNDNLEIVQEKLPSTYDPANDVNVIQQLENTKTFIENNAPPEDDTTYDHIPDLLTQLTRIPFDRPTIYLPDKPLNSLSPEDIVLEDYQSYSDLTFDVAE